MSPGGAGCSAEVLLSLGWLLLAGLQSACGANGTAIQDPGLGHEGEGDGEGEDEAEAESPGEAEVEPEPEEEEAESDSEISDSQAPPENQAPDVVQEDGEGPVEGRRL
jgi:hypothetical protein